MTEVTHGSWDQSGPPDNAEVSQAVVKYNISPKHDFTSLFGFGF